MFTPIRDAVCPVSDRSFARKVAAVALGSALAISGATIYVLGTSQHAHARVRPAIVDESTHLVWRELHEYRWQAFPKWAADHPDRECPAAMADLNAYRTSLHLRDPWGTPYQFLCGKRYGVIGINLRSAGPDRQFQTADDL